MPLPLKLIKNRIRSIENTKKVTNAMQMISVAKLNRVDKQLHGMRPYMQQLEWLLYDIAAANGTSGNQFFKKREGAGQIALCVITSDNGLCGQYNYAVYKQVENFLGQRGRDRVRLIVIGKKGATYFKNKGVTIIKEYTGFNGNFACPVCDDIGGLFKSMFLNGKADEVYIAYTAFKSSLVQNAIIEKFLHLEEPLVNEARNLLEPDAKSIMDTLVERFLAMKMRFIFLQSFTSEHAARSLAMRTATDNADELLDGLTMMRNKVRQTNITQEIMEIISSAEALRG